MQPYHDRRQRLAQLIRERGGGVAVIATAPEVIRNRDAHYPYRWDSYFYYLTGFTEPDAVLVLSVDGSGAESRLFCRDKNEEREILGWLPVWPSARARKIWFRPRAQHR